MIRLPIIIGSIIWIFRLAQNQQDSPSSLLITSTGGLNVVSLNLIGNHTLCDQQIVVPSQN